MRFKSTLAGILIALSGCNTLKVGISSGTSMGVAKEGAILARPLYFNASVELNEQLNISKKAGTVEGSIEVFHVQYEEPKKGFLSGLGIMGRYLTPTKPIEFYAEAGAGPAYLGIQTREQGDPGFNFYDQFGCGIRYALSESASITGGYRYAHISHGRLRRTENRGLNTHSAIVGLQIKY
ncbi:acyloxyacyl hydrolase [Candidatus Woesearchaeota archaeon]|nr:MAG: acyloxyacyl hydrolase [Candidatus Woesearchaeota archaeon]